MEGGGTYWRGEPIFSMFLTAQQSIKRTLIVYKYVPIYMLHTYYDTYTYKGVVGPGDVRVLKPPTLPHLWQVVLKMLLVRLKFREIVNKLRILPGNKIMH
ncbi:MAG: hypothetical protein GY820_19975 [Gammaproteobacteria bacterium]|nr:hypothetical protein [Gammaproteobacteria bacterium]